MRRLIRKNRFAALSVVAYLAMGACVIALTSAPGSPLLAALWLAVGFVFLVVLLEQRKKNASHNLALRKLLDRHDKHSSDQIERQKNTYEETNERLGSAIDKLRSDLELKTNARLSLYDLNNRERFRILSNKLDLMRANSKNRSDKLVTGQQKTIQDITKYVEFSATQLTNTSNSSLLKLDQLKNFTSSAMAIQRTEDERFQQLVLRLMNDALVNTDPAKHPKE